MTNTVDILKSLTQITYDSVEGYRKAYEKADSPALKQAFERRANQRSLTLGKLNDALQSKGETPINTASTSSKVHQFFMNITDVWADDNEAAVKRVEEGEDYIVEQFRDALEDDSNDFDSSTRMVITTALTELREGERFADMLEEQFA